MTITGKKGFEGTIGVKDRRRFWRLEDMKGTDIFRAFEFLDEVKKSISSITQILDEGKQKQTRLPFFFYIILLKEKGKK